MLKKSPQTALQEAASRPIQHGRWGKSHAQDAVVPICERRKGKSASFFLHSAGTYPGTYPAALSSWFDRREPWRLACPTVDAYDVAAARLALRQRVVRLRPAQGSDRTVPQTPPSWVEAYPSIDGDLSCPAGHQQGRVVLPCRSQDRQGQLL